MRQYAVLFLSVLAACGSEPDDPVRAAGPRPDGPLTVAAVNQPVAYFAERIGGELVTVELPQLDGDPAFWSPSAETVLAFQEADLILLNGAGYAKWTQYASLPPSRTIDTMAESAARRIAQERVAHTHGPQGEHDHGAYAFTTWLDPTLAIEQARAVGAALGARVPAEAEAMDARFEALSEDLLALDERLAGAFAQGPERMIASHPVYQYLARRYELELVSLHWEPDVQPDEAGWRELDAALQEEPASWMLWEGEPLPEVRTALAERGVGCIVFEPAGNRSGDDFLTVMNANADAVEAALGAR